MADTKRAVIWKAVSSEAQAKDDMQSLTYQETQARDWCTANGFTVTQVLDLPGHSRSECDVITALEELAQEGCYAYHDLRRMWQQQTVDMLVVHTIDRLARSRSLFIWVVENVIKSGGEIHFMTPGMTFNKGNVDYTVPMALMGLRSGLDVFFEKSAATKAAKLAKGIPVHGKKPFGYIVLYDDKHRPCGIAVDTDPKKRALLEDAAALLLGDVEDAGHVSMRKIEEELFQRFGHNKNSKPYPRNFLRNIFDNPWTWGHASNIHTGKNKKVGAQASHPWLFDSEIAVPPEIEVYWNTHEPLFEEALANRLKEELRVRRLVVTGTGSAESKAFTGLVLCGYCGGTLVHQAKPGHAGGLQCRKNMQRTETTHCPKPNVTSEWVSVHRVRDYAQSLIEIMLDNDSPTLDNERQPDNDAQLQRVRDEINALRLETMNLITRSAKSSGGIGDLFQAQIDERAVRIDALESQRGRLEARLATHHPRSQALAFEELKARRDDFWTMPGSDINRILHALLGNIRIVVKDNRVAGRTTV